MSLLSIFTRKEKKQGMAVLLLTAFLCFVFLGDVSISHASETTEMKENVKKTSLSESKFTVSGPLITYGLLKGPTKSIGTDKTGLLNMGDTVGEGDLDKLVVTITQNDKVLEAGDKIDSKSGFSFRCSFQIPVGFDIPAYGVTADESTYIKGGDWVEFDLDNRVELETSTSNPIPIYDGEGNQIANAVFGGGKVQIIFTDVINPNTGIHTVKVEAEFDCSFDDSGLPDVGGDEVITIVSKDFTVEVPAKETTIKGTKSGEVDTTDNKLINWVVKVSAEAKRPGSDTVTDGNLVGFTFSDILSKDIADSVGDYKENSLKIGKTENIDDAAEVTSGVTWDSATGKLEYPFEEDISGSGKCEGTRYLFFQTNIKDSDYIVDKDKILKNTANISDGADISLDIEGNATIPKKKWIEKKAEILQNGGIAAGGSFDKTQQYIKWVIEVNQDFGNIENTNIIDTLPDGINYVDSPAEYEPKKYNWNDITSGFSSSPVNITPSVSGKNVTFDLGNITKPVKIEFYTKVDDNQGIEHTQKNYKNTAILEGNIIPIEGFKAEASAVGVGVASIKKSSTGYDRSTHTIEWSVTLDSKGQNYGVSNFRILDLLVYGGMDSFKLSECTDSFTGNGDLRDVTNDVLKKTTPNYYQKFKRDSFNGTGLTATFHELKDSSGKVVAELMVVTKDTYGGIDKDTASSFSYKTIVTNPDYYASNNTNKVNNTAGFFTEDVKIRDATASSSNIVSKMMNKTVMSREDADKVINNPEDYSTVNKEGGAGNSFNYNDKSVIFKFHVNANGLTDATEDITTVEGEKLGAFTIDDVLPEGWEFKELAPSEKFWIYEGTSVSATSDKVSANKKLSSTEYGFLEGSNAIFTPAGGGKGEGISFKFNELKNPYVILIKAGPTEEKAKEYFSKNESDYTIRNTAVINNDKIKVDVNDYEDVKFDSTILNKIVDDTTNPQNTDYIKWSVTYNPYNIGNKGNTITDTLPIGIDLRIDNYGKLIFVDMEGKKNIELFEMNMKDDGTLENGTEIALAGTDIVTYDSANRKLRFNIPDVKKAYKLTYITDVEGNKDTKFTNNVELTSSGSGVPVQAKKEFKIGYYSAGASMLRGGWLEINKTDTDGNPLANAEFSLFAENGTVPIKQGVTYNDGILRMKTIYPGDYILMETKTPAGFVVSGQKYAVKVTYDSGAYTTSIEGKTGSDANKITVVNNKENTVGNLEISKTVVGNRLNEDIDKLFDFSIILKNGLGHELTGEFPYVRKDDPSHLGGKVKSGDTIKLAHGQTIAIYDLPGGTICNIKEKDYTSEDYVLSSSGLDADGNVTIEVDSTKEVSFTNVKNLGGLVIQKKVEGNKGDTNKKFKFTLTFSKTGGSAYPYYLNGASIQSGTIKSGDTLELAHSDYIAIPDLPKGAVYKVEEEDYTAMGYVTTASGAEGTIEEGSTKTALFTNIKDTGDLVISKTVMGNDGETDKKFKFTVTITDTKADSYPYKGNGGVSDGVLKCNEANIIELAHGESISVNELPVGTGYEVIEDDYSTEGYVTTKTDDSGVIEIGKTKKAFFYNSRNKGSLIISKKVAGNAGDTSKKFSFIVEFKDKNGNATTESYPYNAKWNESLEGTETSMPAIGIIKSGDMFTLAHEETFTISGILEGTEYKVTERSYEEEGYTVEKEGDSGIITGMSVYEAAFVNTKNITEPEDNENSNNNDKNDNSSENSGGNNESSDEENRDNPIQSISKKDEVPQYVIQKVPNPNKNNSPDKIVLVDKDGNIVGTYTKQQNTDGTFSYVNEKGEVLADSAITKTGDIMPVVGITIIGIIALAGAVLLWLKMKKRIGYYYD